MQDTESLFEICPFGHSEHICHQIAISSFQLSKPIYSLSQLESINLLHLLGRDLLAQEQSPKMPRTTKKPKNSSSTMEKVQEESRAHEESSSSDQRTRPRSLSPTISGTSCPKHVPTPYRRS